MRELGRIVGRINWLGLATIALGFALWELLLRAGFAQYQNLPAPSAIARWAGGDHKQRSAPR